MHIREATSTGTMLKVQFDSGHSTWLTRDVYEAASRFLEMTGKDDVVIWDIIVASRKADQEFQPGYGTVCDHSQM